MSAFLTRLGRGSLARGAVFVVIGAILVLIVLMVLLAIPMLRVPSEASTATRDLGVAKRFLSNGDADMARKLVKDARRHVDAAQDGMTGIGVDLWSAVPVVGTAVQDAQHLVDALDDTTSAVQVATDLYPSISGKQATLFQDGQVDKAGFTRVLSGAQQAAKDLTAAQAALDEVEGTTPFVGATITAKRDEASDQIRPLADGFAKAKPVLDRLPWLLGFEGRRNYLVAMLNPAELRYSGGAVLSFAPVVVDEGKLSFGKSLQAKDDPGFGQLIKWDGVRGNPFHQRWGNKLVNATFAPSWSVSGRELVRGWKAIRDRRQDGVVAVDVVALSRLFGVTGPIDVPGYGTLTEDNLVKTLVGSYDDYYPNVRAQDRLNRALIPTFKRQLLEGGNFVAKGKALDKAAAERHFALYIRDPQTQESLASLGLDGDLAVPDRDYLGVFTQNTNASKVDYYQRRSIALDVALDARGAAEHQLDVTVDNDTPPYALPGIDPQTGYFTRWAGVKVGTFLPDGAEVQQTTVRGEPRDLDVQDFYTQDFVAPEMLLGPGEQGTVHAAYRVRRAASVDSSGRLTYGLSMDPQGMVNPESVQVTVHLPQGYRATSLPDGWSARGRTVTLPSTTLTETQHWRIVATRAD
jgi:hypothetical protein